MKHFKIVNTGLRNASIYFKKTTKIVWHFKIYAIYPCPTYISVYLPGIVWWHCSLS